MGARPRQSTAPRDRGAAWSFNERGEQILRNSHLVEPARLPSSWLDEFADTPSVRRSALLSFTVVLVCAVTALAGFIVGRSGAADLAAARQSGAVIGSRAGARTGDALGRDAGYRAGFRAGYHHAYAPSYRAGYRQAVAR